MTDIAIPTVSDSLLSHAEGLLLAPAGLDRHSLSRVLADIHAHDVDFADLYFQHSRFEGWSLEEGIVKSGAFNIDRGVGVRAVSGDKQAFAYSDDISLPRYAKPPRAVRAIARQGQSAVAPLSPQRPARSLYGRTIPSRSLAEAERCAARTLERNRARRDPRVMQVMAALAGEHDAYSSRAATAWSLPTCVRSCACRSR